MFMKNTDGKIALNVILSAIIVAALLTLVGWLGYNTGLNTAEGMIPAFSQEQPIKDGVDVVLTPISLAENVAMQNSSGIATIDPEAGRVVVDVILPEGTSLPHGIVLEGWVVDAGLRGGLGTSSVSENDQSYGTPFANTEFSEHVDAAPYAHSLGVLTYDDIRATYYVYADVHNGLSPYDAVMITAESDNNAAQYDPRPGTPVMIGEIKL